MKAKYVCSTKLGARPDDPTNVTVEADTDDSVRAIVNYSVGVNHVDLEAAKARGVVVTNTPDVLSDATAEIAMLLMLGAARRTRTIHLASSFETVDFRPSDLVNTAFSTGSTRAASSPFMTA